MKKAGFAPAFLFVPAISHGRAVTTPNKPLMACREHWKSLPVLPMFRTHPLASDPQVRRCAPERSAATRLEMPIWMK